MNNVSGEIKTMTGKHVTWSISGNKMSMYCEGKYCGEAIVRDRPNWDTDSESPKK